MNQKRTDKNKIYSLHEPEVECIAKGKEHKKYEFGTKVALAQTVTDGIIAGARNAFNEYDGNCLAPLFRQVEKTTGKRPERAYCDRGFRGRSNIEGTEIVIPDNPQKERTAHQKSKAQRKFRRRSAVGATISHLKHDFRMVRNYLKGEIGDTMNLLLAATAFNFRKWLRVTALIFFVQYIIEKTTPKLVRESMRGIAEFS